LKNKEVTTNFRSWLSSKILGFFDVVDNVFYVYFVFVSAIPSSEVAAALPQFGFSEDISNSISGFIYNIWTIFSVAIALLISRIMSSRKHKNAKKIKDQLEDEKSQNAKLSETLSSLTPSLRSFYGFTLESILKKVNLDESPKVRISAYLLSSNKEHFMPVGRFSHNAEFRMQGRTLLPFSEGCISEAWKTGKCEWREMSKNIVVRRKKSGSMYQVPEKTFNDLRMKSVALGAYRIVDNTKSPVGVVVIEAVEHSIIDFERFDKVLNDEKDNIQRLISSTQQYLTDPALALEAGV
jgi:hypothetical protein